MVKTVEDCVERAEKVGFPIMVKAGGLGLRVEGLGFGGLGFQDVEGVLPVDTDIIAPDSKALKS